MNFDGVSPTFNKNLCKNNKGESKSTFTCE